MEISRREASAALGGAALAIFPHGRVDGQVPLCGGPDLAGLDEYCFTDSKQVSHQIYVANGGGPPVILLHELPGLTDDDLNAAKKLAADKYTVVMPLMFGTPGGEGDWKKYRKEICGKDQFACGEGKVTSPHVRWLRELSHDVRRRWPDGKGVGVIGMCLTGAFPLAMLSERIVVAHILLQPTVPFNLWTYVGWFQDKSQLGVDPADLRVAAKERDAPVLGLRYQGDWRCRAPRFNRLAKEFDKRFYRLDLPGRHHSTIASDFCPAAFMEVRLFLNQYLRTTPDPTIGTFPRLSEPGVQKEVKKEIKC